MRRVSPTLIVLLFFIVIDSLALYAAYLKQNMDSRPIPLTAPAPQFSWKDFAGHTHPFSEFKGHVVVIHFWASWCQPCRDEFPRLMRAAAEPENKDVMFLTVSSDDTITPAQRFVESVPGYLGINPPENMLYAWDPKKTITYDEFLTVRYPESIIVDPSQHMRRKYPVPVDWSGKEIKAFLKEMKEAK